MLTKHVACGVLQQGGNILIARRPDAGFMGGYWEFPGGKLESGETALDALARELHEELGVRVEQASPLIQLRYDYPEQRVQLHVFRVEHFQGVPTALIGQLLKWVSDSELIDYGFLPANAPILTAVKLPDRYGFVDVATDDVNSAFRRLKDLAQQGIRLLRLRASAVSPADYLTLAAQCVDYCGANHVDLLLNDVPGIEAILPGAAGIHLNSKQLMATNKRPIPSGMKKWVAASCHSTAELRHAEQIGIDFAVLSPVLPTATHADATPLGWQGFGELVEQANLPIFALGGMMPENLQRAKQHGAQGIAAIRGFLQQGLIRTHA